MKANEGHLAGPRRANMSCSDTHEMIEKTDYKGADNEMGRATRQGCWRAE
jgi:hypothetical protein